MTGTEWRGLLNALLAIIPVAVLYVVLQLTGGLPAVAAIPSTLLCGLVVGMASREWVWRPWR